MELRDEIAVEAMKVMLKAQMGKNYMTIEEGNASVDFIKNKMPISAYKIADSMIEASSG